MRFILLFLMLLLVAACETARIPPTTAPQSPTARIPPSAAQSPTAPKRASVQFFLIYEAPASDLAERKVEATGETVFLATKPDLTNADVAWAEMQVDPISSRPSVLVHFTPVGTDKLAALTKQNIGRRMAIILDGRVLATPLITSEIGDGRATLQGFKSAGEAQWVADSLAQR